MDHTEISKLNIDSQLSGLYESWWHSNGTKLENEAGESVFKEVITRLANRDKYRSEVYQELSLFVSKIPMDTFSLPALQRFHGLIRQYSKHISCYDEYHAALRIVLVTRRSYPETLFDAFFK